MRTTRKKLISAVISSSLFGLLPCATQAGLIPVLVTTNSTATPDLGQGYLFSNIVGSITLTINDGYTVGSSLVIIPPVNESIDASTGAIGLSDSVNFAGNATVNGAIGASNPIGTLNLNGASDTVLFEGDVFATNFNFNVDGIAQIADTKDLTATIFNTTGFSGRGTIEFAGGGSLNGTVGTTNAINNITVNSQGGATKTVELTGATVKASTILLDDDGSGNAANGTTLTLNNAAMVVTGNFTNNTHNENTLNVANADQLIGSVGANNQAFNLIKVVANADLDISGNVFAATTQFQANRNLTLADSNIITGAVDTTASNTGKLNFTGSGQVTGNIGNANKLAELNINTANGAAKTMELNGSIVKITTLLLDDDGSGNAANGTTLTLNNAAMVLTGNLVNATHNENTLNVANADQIIGQVGANGSAFNLLKVGANNDLDISGDVFATTTQFQGNKTLTMGDGNIITGVVDSTSSDAGKLNFAGSGQVTGNIGNINKLAELNINTAGGVAETVELNGSVIKATSILLDDDGSGNAANGTTLTLNNAAMVVTGNFTNNTHNENTLNILKAAAFTGNLGSNGQAFKLIKVGANNDLVVNGDIFADLTEFQDDHVIQFNTSHTIHGHIDALNVNSGQVIFESSGQITGDIGVNKTIDSISVNQLGLANQDLELNGSDIQVNTIEITGASSNPTTILLNSAGPMNIATSFQTVNNHVDILEVANQGLTNITGNIGQANKAFNLIKVGEFGDVFINGHLISANTEIWGDNTITIADNVNVEGHIDAISDNWGTLEFDGSTSISGDIGATHYVKSIEVNGLGASILFKGDVNAQIININAPSTITIADDKRFYGPVTATAFFMGNLKFAGSSVIDFCIGDDPLDTVEFNGGAGSNVILNNDILAKNALVNGGGRLSIIDAVDIDANLSVTNSSTINLNVVANPVLVTGDFLLDAGTTFQLNMNNLLAAGLINVQGTATVSPNAKIDLLNVPLNIPDGDTLITILIDGAGGGGLNPLPVTSTNLFATFSSQVNGNELQLVISSISSASITNFCPELSISMTMEELVNTPTTGTLNSIIHEIADFTSAHMLCESLKALEPIVDNAIINETFESQRLAFSMLDERASIMHYCKANPNELVCKKELQGLNNGDFSQAFILDNLSPGTWLKLYGYNAHQSERQEIAGYKNNLSGIAGGMDTLVEQYLLGVALSYSSMEIHHQDYTAQTQIRTWQEIFYGNYLFASPLYVNWALGLAHNAYHINKDIAFGTLELHVEDKFNSWQTGMQTEWGYDIALNDTYHAIPLLLLFYSHIHFDNYTQLGLDSANQRLFIDNSDQLLGGLGLKNVWNFSDGLFLYQPEIHVMVLHDFIGDNARITAQFVGGGSPFETIGFTPAKSGLNIGGSLTFFSASQFSLYTKLDLQIKEEYHAISGYIKARYTL